MLHLISFVHKLQSFAACQATIQLLGLPVMIVGWLSTQPPLVVLRLSRTVETVGYGAHNGYVTGVKVCSEWGEERM